MSELRKNWIAPIITGTIAAVFGGLFLLVLADKNVSTVSKLEPSTAPTNRSVSITQLGDQLNRDEIHEYASGFSKCVALYKIMSGKTENLGVHTSRTFGDAARGANIAAFFFLSKLFDDPKKREDMYITLVSNSRSILMSLLELKGGSISALEDELKKCAKLNPLQTKVVNYWRKLKN